jgi:hypothetical protein
VIVFELTGSEQHPVYQDLEISNGNRHYDFLLSIVVASLQMQRPFLSQQIVKALNFHAISCLHIRAGEYRPCEVTAGQHRPPFHYRVPALHQRRESSVGTNRSCGTRDLCTLEAEQRTPVHQWELTNRPRQLLLHPVCKGRGLASRHYDFA